MQTPLDYYNRFHAITVTGGLPVVHLISVPGESALIRNTKRQLPGPADADLPAITIVESTASKDDVDGLSGLARSFYAYSESGTLAGVFKVLHGLNDDTMNVRIESASWNQVTYSMKCRRNFAA